MIAGDVRCGSTGSGGGGGSSACACGSVYTAASADVSRDGEGVVDSNADGGSVMEMMRTTFCGAGLDRWASGGPRAEGSGEQPSAPRADNDVLDFLASSHPLWYLVVDLGGLLVVAILVLIPLDQTSSSPSS